MGSMGMSEAILPRPQGLNSRGVDVSLLLSRREMCNSPQSVVCYLHAQSSQPRGDHLLNFFRVHSFHMDLDKITPGNGLMIVNKLYNILRHPNQYDRRISLAQRQPFDDIRN